MRFTICVLIAFRQKSRIFGTPGPAGPWVAFWLRFETGVCVLAAFWDLRFELRLRLRFGPSKFGMHEVIFGLNTVNSGTCPPRGLVCLSWFDAAARPLGVCPPHRLRRREARAEKGGGRRRRQQCSIQNEYPTKECGEQHAKTVRPSDQHYPSKHH